MTDRKALGDAGEVKGREFIAKQGYRVLAHNYRTRYGEIDCVARDRGDLVFVEIKLRTSDIFGRPFEAVTPVKQRRIVQAALQYVKEHRLHRENLRFDVVSIGAEGTIELIRAAFSAPARYTY